MMLPLWLAIAQAAPEADDPPAVDAALEEGPRDELPVSETMLEGPDRSGPPAVVPPEPLALDDLTRHSLGDGLDVWLVNVPRLRKAEIEVVWWKGRTDLSEGYEPAHSAMASIWDTATEAYDGDALSELTDVLDVDLWAYLGDHRAGAGVQVPLEDLDKGLDILAEVALRPAFPKRELKLDQEQTERYYTVIGPASPSRVTSSAMSYGWNPADHPYGYRPDPEAYSALKRKDLVAVHEQLLQQGPVSIVVVGDVTWEDMEPRLKKRFGALGAAGERSETLDAPTPSETRVLLIPMDDAEQVSLMMKVAAPDRLDETFAPMSAVSYALGGHFLARLNKNLREEKGWTYGAGAWYSAGEKRGSFNVSVDVPGDKAAAAVREIESELETIASEGVTQEELDAWWRAEVMEFNTVRGTLDDATRFYGALLVEEVEVADRRARLDAFESVSIEDTTAIAADVLGPDAPRMWVMTGPEAALKAAVDDLGWEAETITPRQAIVGDL
jgi:zinc protease